MKGQAALEFLTTYAWAFLMVILAIGAFTYFGIFDPEKVLPEYCQMESSGVQCTDSRVEINPSGPDIRFNLVNGGETMVNIQMYITLAGNPDSTVPCWPCEGFSCIMTPYNLRSGENVPFVCWNMCEAPSGSICKTSPLSTESSLRFHINGTYKKPGGSREHLILGEMYTH